MRAPLPVNKYDEVFPPKPSPGCGWCDYQRLCPEGQQAATPRRPWDALAELNRRNPHHPRPTPTPAPARRLVSAVRDWRSGPHRYIRLGTVSRCAKPIGAAGHSAEDPLAQRATALRVP
jgi:hypothetical protein